MKNPVLSLILLFMLVSGTHCIKDKTCTPKTPSSEAATIQAYAGLNGIAAVPHSSGLYYEILDAGTGPAATTTSTIFITYTGKMLDGTVFDQQSNAAATGWPLNQLIEGWRIGIPLIKEGGHIRLLIPSSMAYGCTGYGGIPGDAILDFDITLVDVQ
ncbi:MAG: FKBP-type peptidyl-prolyl cis-trans isomerase [Chitinophagaceae bacterium]|nr:FKBP-type peptidyl-prolyl cis-trans isomerase [Chitinophagaceae bacterium]